MKLRSAAFTLVLASCAVHPPGPEHSGPLAEVAGRTPGLPSKCVSIQQSEALRIAEDDRHTLIYGTIGKIWVNHLGPDCGFRQDDVLVTYPFGSSYCQGDIVRSIDRSSHILGPACVLGPFTPYTR